MSARQFMLPIVFALVMSCQSLAAAQDITLLDGSVLQFSKVKLHHTGPVLDAAQWQNALLDSKQEALLTLMSADSKLPEQLELTTDQAATARRLSTALATAAETEQTNFLSYLKTHYQTDDLSSIGEFDGDAKQQLERHAQKLRGKLSVCERQLKSTLTPRQWTMLLEEIHKSAARRKAGAERLLQPLRLAVALGLADDELQRVRQANLAAAQKYSEQLKTLRADASKRILEKLPAGLSDDLRTAIEYEALRKKREAAKPAVRPSETNRESR